MTPALAQARCLHHPAREAVCRCPICARYFCRECITEHEGRFLCSRCVAEMPASLPSGRRWGAAMLSIVMTAGGFILIVLFFYLAGVFTSVYAGRPNG